MAVKQPLLLTTPLYKMNNPILNTDHYDTNREEYGSRRYLMGVWKGVVAENRDPSGLGRLKIRIWQLHGDEFVIHDRDLPWAHPIISETGAFSGSFDIPEKGSKVWVQFEQGDINHPVWFGGWATGNYGPDDPPSATAQKVQAAATQTASAAKAASDASKSVATAAQAANAALGAITGGSGISGAQKGATQAVGAIASLASDPANATPSVINSAQKTLSLVTASQSDAQNTLQSIEQAQNAVSDAKSALQAAQSAATGLSSVRSSLDGLVQGAQSGASMEIDLAVEASKSIIGHVDSITSQVESVSNVFSQVDQTVSALANSANSVIGHAGDIVNTRTTAINAVQGGYTSVDALIGQMGNLQNIIQGVSDKITGTLNNIVGDVTDKVDSILGLSKTASKVSDLLHALTKATEGNIVEKVAKVMGKKEADPPIYALRPEKFADTPWPVGPGSEIPHESQAMSNNVPSVRIWKKSSKGHTMLCEDQDGKEMMAHIDRAGNALYFNCPVTPELNAGNSLFRGQKSVLTGDAINRQFMRDRGSKIGLQDQAQSKVELDSRDGAAKIIIIANDGRGGIETGEDRQKIELLADGKTILIESVKNGETNAKVMVDANSGVVVIETARFITMNAPYVSITSDHINLNGRAVVNGDLCVNGRITGGNK